MVAWNDAGGCIRSATADLEPCQYFGSGSAEVTASAVWPDCARVPAHESRRKMLNGANQRLDTSGCAYAEAGHSHATQTQIFLYAGAGRTCTGCNFYNRKISAHR